MRWHAAIGLLRGLAEGRLVGAEVRKLAVAALDAAVEQGLHRDTPLLAPLEALLRGQRALLLAHPSHLVPEDDVRAIEARLSCRHGLLERDLKATTVARANDLMREDLLHLGGITGLKPGAEKDRQGSSKRFVERHLTAWPYFSRLDLLRDRGRRPAPQLLSDLPDKVLDR